MDFKQYYNRDRVHCPLGEDTSAVAEFQPLCANLYDFRYDHTVTDYFRSKLPHNVGFRHSQGIYHAVTGVRIFPVGRGRSDRALDDVFQHHGRRRRRFLADHWRRGDMPARLAAVYDNAGRSN